MQQTLRIVDTWCKKTKFSIVRVRRMWLTSPDGTSAGLRVQMKLGGQQMKITERAKYLRVILYRKLPWNEDL